MKLPVLDIDVKINNKSLPTDTIGDLERLHHDIGELVRWLKAAPQIGASYSASDGPAAPAFGNGSAQTPPAPEGTRVLDTPPVSTDKMTVADYAAAALFLLGGRATYMSVLDEMRGTLRWETRASNQKNARRILELAARQRGDLMEVGGGVMTLTEKGHATAEGLATVLRSAALVPEGTHGLHGFMSSAKPRPSSHPELGSRAIDALVLGLYEADKPVAQRDGATLVSRYGWDVLTKSAHPDLLVNSKARKYPEYVIAADGQYRLTDKGKRLAQEIKSIRALDSTPGGPYDSQETKRTQSRSESLFADEPHGQKNKPPIQQGNATERRRMNPPPGKQLIDRILYAVAGEGGTATMDHVITRMLEEGWQTKSGTLIQKRRTAQAALYNFPGNLSYEDGVLTITPQGYKRLQDAKLAGESQQPSTTQGDGSESNEGN